MKTYTFILRDTERFTVKANSALGPGGAFEQANRKIGHVKNFYGWMGSGFTFRAQFGAWD
jgi:hypothetical protein